MQCAKTHQWILAQPRRIDNSSSVSTGERSGLSIFQQQPEAAFQRLCFERLEKAVLKISVVIQFWFSLVSLESLLNKIPTYNDKP